MGKPLSAEHRLHISQALKGKPRPLETRLKISKTQKGRPLSPERRAKLVERILLLNHSRKGIARSDETKAKISQAHKDVAFSPEHKLHLSQSLKGRTLSGEHKLHVSQSTKGKPLSPKRTAALKKMQEARIGTTHSPLAKTKMSKAKKGKALPAEHKENLLAALRTPEHRQKMSGLIKEAWTKPGVIEKISGENNSNWLGGKSFEPYTPDFNSKTKKIIKERDNNACCLCGGTYRLQIHHIDYDKNNSSHHNLITLCNSCHAKTGKNRNYWTEYFKVLQ